MPEVRMTTFADYLVASPGSPRITAIKRAKQQYATPYDTRTDYYGPFRKALIREFEAGLGRQSIGKALGSTNDHKKIPSYQECADGLKGFLRRKRVSRSHRERARWLASPLTVIVNPELCLAIDGQPHVVKLYFKKQPLSQQRADLLLQLMQETLGKSGTPMILDVRRGKAFVPRQVAGLSALLRAEAAAYSHLWQAL
ncbi:MAG TPA: hypothetical protein VF715_08150 [Thermoleophilaceae bacterium]